jgi:hypothetical protein
MKNFIEVPRKEDNVLINVNHIFMVEKQKNGGTRISLAIRGHHNYAFQYADTSLAYKQVVELINNAQ